MPVILVVGAALGLLLIGMALGMIIGEFVYPSSRKLRAGDRVYAPGAFSRRGVVMGKDKDPQAPKGSLLVAWLSGGTSSCWPHELRIEKHMSDWRGL